MPGWWSSKRELTTGPRLTGADRSERAFIPALVFALVTVPLPRPEHVAPGVAQERRAFRAQRGKVVSDRGAVGAGAKRAPLRHNAGDQHVREAVWRLARLRSDGCAEGAHTDQTPAPTDRPEPRVAIMYQPPVASRWRHVRRHPQESLVADCVGRR